MDRLKALSARGELIKASVMSLFRKAPGRRLAVSKVSTIRISRPACGPADPDCKGAKTH